MNLNKLRAVFKAMQGCKNLSYPTKTEGVVLEVEREEGGIEVGDIASPNGTFELEDGTKIVVEENIVVSVEKPENSENENSENPNEIIENFKNKLARINALVSKQQEALEESAKRIEDLQKIVNEQKARLEPQSKALNLERNGSKESEQDRFATKMAEKKELLKSQIKIR